MELKHKIFSYWTIWGLLTASGVKDRTGLVHETGPKTCWVTRGCPAILKFKPSGCYISLSHGPQQVRGILFWKKRPTKDKD